MKVVIGAVFILSLTSCGDRSEPTTTTSTSTSLALSELENYAAAVVAATDGAVTFVSVRQTTTTPMNGFRITFKTGHDALMSSPEAEPGNAAYITNVGRTKAWSARFCTPKLKAIMSRYQVDIVTGNLTDLTGDTQSMAIC